MSSCQELGIKGTILLASEGINSTIAGLPEAIAAFLANLAADDRFGDLNTKESDAAEIPFKRLKIKIEPEIVTFRQPNVDPTRRVGKYLSPQEWNATIVDPATIVIDTRNDFEVAIGSFSGAIDPQTKKFTDFPAYIEANIDPDDDIKIALYCTGGIRCEKATAYLLEKGFKEVYHLEGGILKYLAEIPPEESLWQGECFVFDDRVSLQHGLIPGNYTLCQSCGYPLDPTECQSQEYIDDRRCSHCPKID